MSYFEQRRPLRDKSASPSYLQAIAIMCAWHHRLGAKSSLSQVLVSRDIGVVIGEMVLTRGTNVLDRKKCGRNGTITEHGTAVGFCGGGCCLAEKGYTSGSHHWEFTLWEHSTLCDRGCSHSPSWVGVSACCGGEDFDTPMRSEECYVCVAVAGVNDRKPVIVGKRLQGDMVVEGYKNSYRVGFTLHCDHGLLDYYLNGRLQMRIPYGQCVELRGKPLFPAFSASMSTNSEQAISYVDIEF